VKLKQKQDKMMKTKTLVTTMALTGALLASASVAKANAFLEIITKNPNPGLPSDFEQQKQTTDDPATLAVNDIGGWDFVSEIGSSATSPLEIDLAIKSGTSSQPLNPLWIIYSVSVPSTSGKYNLETFTGGNGVKTVNTWLYSKGVGLTPVPLGAPPEVPLSSLPMGGGFASQSITSPGSANTSASVSGLTAYTEIIEVIPGTKKNTVSIDSNFTVVPDGGLTVAMLGSLLMGLAGFRSKFGKRA
jgi:hypothetical protein